MTDPSDPLAGIRASYELDSLSEDDLAPTWLEQFEVWLEAALASGMPEPNAMILATAGADGVPSARTMLLRGVDRRGFSFFTNYESRKGRELAANPHATLVFPWHFQQRQVVVDGTVELLSAAESDEYFASRPRGSRISANASPQSQVIETREWLERRVGEIEQQVGEAEEVPRPDGWGGLLLRPEAVEFWQGGTNRLHDRLRYRHTASGAWVIERLAP